MVIAALAVVVIAVGALCAWSAGYLQLLKKTVIVHTKEGDASIRGVLIRSHRDLLVLEDAEYLDATRGPRQIGRTHVPRANVNFIQEPGSADIS